MKNLFEYEQQTRKLTDNSSVKFSEPEVASPEKAPSVSSKKSSVSKSALKTSAKAEKPEQSHEKALEQMTVEDFTLSANDQSYVDLKLSEQEVKDLKQATRESIMQEIRDRKVTMGMPDVELNIDVLASIVEDVLCEERAVKLGAKLSDYAVCMHASFCSLKAFEKAQRKQALLLRELHEENKEYARIMIQQLSEAVGKYD